MIVMPLGGDQWDNAQRVHEKGFGIRLNPQTVSEQELLNAIEKLLNDKELKHNLSVASKHFLHLSHTWNQLTILLAPLEAVGSVNACIGLAEVLLSRGHRIVFAVNQSFAGKLSPFGFIEEILNDETGKLPAENAAKSLLASGLLSDLTPEESMEMMCETPIFADLIDKMRANEPKLKTIIAKYNPDVYIIDDFAGSPTIIHSNKPWIHISSSQPLSGIRDDRTPPGWSGYPSDSDRQKWSPFNELKKNIFKSQIIKYNKWMEEEGHPLHTANKSILESPYLNIYGYPEELDYTDIRPIPEKWIKIETFMRKGEQEFKIPDKFRDRNVEKCKLIYLSLGSMGSANVDLMKRLVSILSKSQHKFIVSKGVFGDTYELADNMWGEKSVPQTKVLPLVDVVITHGGNNSVTETFSC
ncbi:unnamed protein product, partial [Medioppia subpectinata]